MVICSSVAGHVVALLCHELHFDGQPDGQRLSQHMPVTVVASKRLFVYSAAKNTPAVMQYALYLVK